MRLTGPKIMLVTSDKNPGTSIGRVDWLSERTPITVCAENSQESIVTIMMIVQREILACALGDRADSI